MNVARDRLLGDLQVVERLGTVVHLYLVALEDGDGNVDGRNDEGEEERRQRHLDEGHARVPALDRITHHMSDASARHLTYTVTMGAEAPVGWRVTYVLPVVTVMPAGVTVMTTWIVAEVDLYVL